jgi:hypothetical protein
VNVVDRQGGSERQWLRLDVAGRVDFVSHILSRESESFDRTETNIDDHTISRCREQRAVGRHLAPSRWTIGITIDRAPSHWPRANGVSPSLGAQREHSADKRIASRRDDDRFLRDCELLASRFQGEVFA